MRALFLAAVMAASLGIATPASADDSSTFDRDRMEELARQGMAKIVQALELMLRAIPQYEMPEVTEEGDIIIRRKRLPPREKPDDKTDDEADDEAET